MKIGMVGLGKMGYNLTLNLLDHKYDVVTHDINDSLVEKSEAEGAEPAYSIAELVQKLPKPRIVWLMVPAGEVTEEVIVTLSGLLDEGDIIIDGGNSNYKDTLRRAALLEADEIHFVDVGTSGGVEGARHGVCMMVGGPERVVTKLTPMFEAVSVEDGFLASGEVGSGHFLKMIHNGIEYGMMQSIAEGFEILEKSQFTFNYEEVARVWNNGSVIRSWLMELTENAFSKDPKLESILGVMHSSGEGKWTVETALQLETAAPVIALSLMMRYRSLEEDTFSGKIVAALRNEFGGHDVVKANGENE